MQNVVDMMAMVQKSSMVKQRAESALRSIGFERSSFKKELAEARSSSYADQRNSTKTELKRPVESNRDNQAEKLAKVMTNNKQKTEVKENFNDSEVKPLEETTSAEETIKEEEKIQETAVSAMEMLQQLMQMLKGLSTDTKTNPELLASEEKLQTISSELQQILVSNSEKSVPELTTLMKSLQAEVSKLIEQLHTKGITAEKQPAQEMLQLLNDLVAKLNKEKKPEQKIILNDQLIVKEPVKVQESLKVENKPLIITGESSAEAEAVTDDQKIAVAKDDGKKDKADNSKDKPQDSEAQLSQGQKDGTSTLQSVEKPQAESFKEVALINSEKPNLQVNVKELNLNSQKTAFININKSEIVNQVVKKADIILREGHSEMIMKLEPEALGKLNLKVMVENGLVTAKFIAESQQVKEVLESSFNQLKDALQEKGITVQGFSVSVGQEGKEFNSQQGFDHWKRSIKMNSKSTVDYIESDAMEGLSQNPYSYHDGKVDFKA